MFKIIIRIVIVLLVQAILLPVSAIAFVMLVISTMIQHCTRRASWKECWSSYIIQWKDTEKRELHWIKTGELVLKAKIES